MNLLESTNSIFSSMVEITFTDNTHVTPVSVRYFKSARTECAYDVWTV